MVFFFFIIVIIISAQDTLVDLNKSSGPYQTLPATYCLKAVRCLFLKTAGDLQRPEQLLVMKEMLSGVMQSYA